MVFSKEWFKKHNKKLCWLARLPILGELVFNFKKYGHYVDRKKIVEVTPNSVIEFVKKKGKKVELKQHFFTRNEYALRLQKVFYPIWITFHIWDIITRLFPQLNLGFDTLTVYPEPGTTTDGYVYRDVISESWSTIRDGVGTNSRYDQTSNYLIGIISGSSGWNALYRYICCFDTSDLTSSASISATVLSLYVNSKLDGDENTPNIDIYTSNPALTSSLTNTDYGNVGTTSQTGSPIAYGDISTSAYNNFTFNATGRGNILKTGISKFGARNANYDVANSEPPNNTGAGKVSRMIGTGGASETNKPKLVVTYTTLSAFIPRTMWFN